MRKPSGRRVDIAVAIVWLAAMEPVVAFGEHGSARWVQMVATVPIAGAIAQRRRWPLGALVVVEVIGAVVFGTTSDVTAALALVTVVLMAYGVAVFASDRRAWVGLGTLIVFATCAGARSTLVVPSIFFLNVAVAILPWACGRVARDHARREEAYRLMAEELDARREQQTGLARVAERTRLAQELHDVVGHCVSVMVIQAGAARAVLGTDVERADAALGAAQRAGHDALVEMRRLLAALDDPRRAAPLDPQPGLDDVRALIEQTTAAGVATSLRVEGTPSRVSPGVELCAYRVVQEALTNTIKHAGSARANVHIQWTDDAVELEIVDTGRGVPAALPLGGHGLLGMRERVGLHGGSLEAGSLPDGGFSVLARIPLEMAGAMT